MRSDPRGFVLRNWLWLTALLLVVAAVAAGAVWWRPAKSVGARRLGPTAEVKRGEMLVTMKVGGELRADSRTVISGIQFGSFGPEANSELYQKERFKSQPDLLTSLFDNTRAQNTCPAF